MNSNEDEESEEISEEDIENEENKLSNNYQSETNVKNLNIEKNFIEKDNDIIIVSLKLMKKINELHAGDLDNILIDYISKIGLPIKFKNQKSLSIYLYFHKICSRYYAFFSQFFEKKIIEIILSLLKENYYILADSEESHYNFIYIAEKIFPKLFLSHEDNSNEKIPFIIIKCNDNNMNSKKGKSIIINKLILELCFESEGRLDIYMKIHILKSIMLYINNPKLSSYILLFEKMESDLINLYKISVSNKLDEYKYEQMVNIFTDIEKQKKWEEYLLNLKKLLSIFQNIKDEKSIKILEKLSIQLLGHFNRKIRNSSVKMLNMIYDNNTWQDRGSYPLSNTFIKFIEDKIIVDVVIKINDFTPQSIILITSKPSENKNINYQCISYLKPIKETISKNEAKLTFSLGTAKKCGYYDWYLVKFTKGRFTNIKIINSKKEIILGKGRFIVLNKDIKNLSINEVLCDLIDSNLDNEINKFKKIGSFKNLENKLEHYNKNENINCIYIMGALERDNNIIYDEETGKVIDIGNKYSSPMAVTSRSDISSLLGGDKEFISLINKAHKLSMKIIIDSFARISSTRFNRKYRNILLRHLDKDNKVQIYYGSEGKNIKYDDSLMLNYRKIEAWDLLISEIKILIEKYNIDGIYIDNCQSWPNIMKLNISEMYRIDLDGKRAYSSLEILNGEIIEPNIETGYWDSDECENYPNPFFIKFTKNIWKCFTKFIFLGECWINEKNMKIKRHKNLLKSGIIPRMNYLPIIINELLGIQLKNDGSMDKIPEKNVNLLEKCYNEIYKELPEGSLIIQNTYPQSFLSYINEKVLFPIVDLLFFLPDIPITYMEEEKDIYKLTYIYENISGNINTSIKVSNNNLIKIIKEIDEERQEKEINNNTNNYIYSLIGNYFPLFIKLKKNNEIYFDSKKVNNHYNFIRKLRLKHESIQYGKLIFLKALDKNGNSLSGLLSFARQTKSEIGIFIFNFRDEEINFFLDLTSLFGKDIDSNTIVCIEKWDNEEKERDYYLFGELTKEYFNKEIRSYQNIYLGLSITDFNVDNYKKALIKKTNNFYNNKTDDKQIINELKEILKRKLSLEEFNSFKK